MTSLAQGNVVNKKLPNFELFPALQLNNISFHFYFMIEINVCFKSFAYQDVTLLDGFDERRIFIDDDAADDRRQNDGG